MHRVNEEPRFIGKKTRLGPVVLRVSEKGPRGRARESAPKLVGIVNPIRVVLSHDVTSDERIGEFDRSVGASIRHVGVSGRRPAHHRRRSSDGSDSGRRPGSRRTDATADSYDRQRLVLFGDWNITDDQIIVGSFVASRRLADAGCESIYRLQKVSI